MGLLSVRNASEPSFTSGSTIALLTDPSDAAAALASLYGAHGGGGAGFSLHSYDGVFRGRRCAAAEIFALHAYFFLERKEEREGRRKSELVPLGSGMMRTGVIVNTKSLRARSVVQE